MYTVRTCTDLAELRRAIVIGHYFAGELSDEDLARFGRVLDPSRMHAARDGDLVVGGAGAFDFDISLPGGRQCRSAGVTVVGVYPTHRRTGVLTAMMNAQLREVHARGEPIAWLWASEGTIYGRFGYGMAAMAGDIELDRRHTQFLGTPEAGLRTRLVDAEEAIAILPPIYEAASRLHPGMFSRTREWWEARRLADPPSRRGGGGTMARVVVERAGTPVAYALYRIHQSFEHNVTTGTLSVIEAVGADPQATRAIWSYLVNVDWVAKIRAVCLPVDHELLLLLAEPRRARFTLSDSLWVRLVDLPASLGARDYASPESLTFEVSDPMFAHNTGRWRLAGGSVQRTEEPPDLVLDVDVLGSAYLGGMSFRRLHAAGRLQERVAGAVARADRLFAADRAPWCPEIF